MADQSVTCPTCGKKIPLTKALRADIEDALKRQFEHDLTEQERRLRESFERTLESDRERVLKEALTQAERKLANDLAAMSHEITEQARELEEARRQELALRKRERDLERQRQDLEVTLARQLDEERHAHHRAKRSRADRGAPAEGRREGAPAPRHAAADRGPQTQGRAGLAAAPGRSRGETARSILRGTFPLDEITGSARASAAPICTSSSSTRAAGASARSCGSARTRGTGATAWIAKLKADQRAMRADVAVLVTACLPKGCRASR